MVGGGLCNHVVFSCLFLMFFKQIQWPFNSGRYTAVNQYSNGKYENGPVADACPSEHGDIPLPY